MKTFKRIIGIDGLSNLGFISENPLILRGAMPEVWEEAYESLRQLGVKIILNLRTHEEKAPDGFIVIHYPLFVLKTVSVAEFDDIVKIMSQGNVFVHCLQGHDRTGVGSAAYRIAIDKWTFDEAMEEMQSYGFNDMWIPLTISLKKYAEAKCAIR